MFDGILCAYRGVLSYMHAVESPYHKHFVSPFFSNRKLKYNKQSASTTQSEIDTRLKHFMKILSADKCSLILLELFTFSLTHHYSCRSQFQHTPHITSHIVSQAEQDIACSFNWEYSATEEQGINARKFMIQ